MKITLDTTQYFSIKLLDGMSCIKDFSNEFLCEPFISVTKSTYGTFLLCSKSAFDAELARNSKLGASSGRSYTIEAEWRMLHVSGISLSGMSSVVANISQPLASMKIPIFVISTINADFILVKADKVHLAIEALNKSGFSVEESVTQETIS